MPKNAFLGDEMMVATAMHLQAGDLIAFNNGEGGVIAGRVSKIDKTWDTVTDDEEMELREDPYVADLVRDAGPIDSVRSASDVILVWGVFTDTTSDDKLKFMFISMRQPCAVFERLT